jgi:tetratricopeptide (TPR) repeat protein
MLRGQIDVLARELDATLTAAPDGADPELLARSRLALARALHELGRPDAAERAYEAAVAGARAIGDATLVALAHCGLGRLVAGLGEWERACALFDEARGAKGAALRVTRLARACFEFYGSEIGASSDARAAVAEYVETCRRGADPRELVFWLVQLGRVDTELLRDRPSAKACFDEALALARSLGDLRGEGFALFGLGTHLLAHGPVDEARSTLAQAAAALHEAGTRRYEA